MKHETHWGIVFSDVVVRAVAALDQYKLISKAWPESERFEATLTLSVAQTVLSAASELERALSRQTCGDEPDLAEIHDFVSLDHTTYLSRTGDTDILTKDELGGSELLTHMRNALSHPVPCTPGGGLPLTGYVRSSFTRLSCCAAGLESCLRDRRSARLRRRMQVLRVGSSGTATWS
jgi:hypothetical protein